jgi:hypothetical protein
VKDTRPVHELMDECARALGDSFTRDDITRWFRRNYPDLESTTVAIHISGLTAGRNPDSFPHLSKIPPVFERVGPGLYQRTRRETAHPRPTTRSPVVVARGRTGPTPARPADAEPPDAVLVGCATSTLAQAAPARDLYNGALFARRRDYGERSGAPWFVVSGRWGLITPDEVVAPDDLTLADMPAAYRDAWADFVVAQLAGHLPLDGARIEIHADGQYAAALGPAFGQAGAALVDPVDAGATREAHTWYANTAANQPRPAAAAAPVTRNVGKDVPAQDAEDAPPVDRLVAALCDLSAALTPAELRARRRRDYLCPGLYTWWADDAGAADLTRGLAHYVYPGLIYAGQVGATRWPSGKPSTSTLWGVLVGMHLGGQAHLSRFRLSLAAVLSQLWNHSFDEQRLTAWMDLHLAVVAVPVDDADGLAALEAEILDRLNPPLNLKNRPPTPLRKTLGELRSGFRA